jgi:hypothetical protein
MVHVHDVLFKQKHYDAVWSSNPLLTFIEHHILLPLNCTSEFDSRPARQGIPAVHGTQRTIPVLTTAHTWTRSIPRQIHSAPLYSIYLTTRKFTKHELTTNTLIPRTLFWNTRHSGCRWHTSDLHVLTTDVSVFVSLWHQVFFMPT